MIDYLIKAHDSREKTNVKMLCLYKQNMQPTIMSSLYLLLNPHVVIPFPYPVCTTIHCCRQHCSYLYDSRQQWYVKSHKRNRSISHVPTPQRRLHVELQNCLSCLGCALRQTACYSYISWYFPICITVNRLLALFNCSRLLSSFSILGLARTWNMIQRERAAPVLRLSGRMMQLNEGCTQGQQLSHVK